MKFPLDYACLGIYVASCIAYIANLYRDKLWIGRLATLLLICGLVTQYFALLQRAHVLHTVPYDDFYGSMSLFAWLIVLTYLGLEAFHKQRAVGSLVLPFVIFWVIVAMIVAPARGMKEPHSSGVLFALHITIEMLSYAAFAISFLLSVIYLVQNRILRRGKPGLAFWRFPSLDLLERMSRSSVIVGWVAMLAGTIMGFAWEHDLTGRVRIADPKVLVTLLILAAYAIYLVIVRAPAWRGARAALICASNFFIVLFSYTVVNLYLTSFHRYFR